MPRKIGACILCQSSSASFGDYADVRGWKYVRCGVCGLVFLNPQPTPEELKAFYDTSYQYDLKCYRNSVSRQEKWLEILENLCGGTGSLLEVGCSYGYFLALARSRGWAVQGVELGDSAVQFAISKLQLPVQTGRIQDVQSGRFDAIVAWHVLEHDPDPGGFIQAAFRLLRPGGVLGIRVPNLASAVSKLAGNCWQWLSPPEHVCMYTARTLSRFVAQYSLDLESIVSLRGNGRNILFEIIRARLKSIMQRRPVKESEECYSFVPPPRFNDKFWYRLAEFTVAAGMSPIDWLVSRYLSARCREAEIAVFARKGKTPHRGELQEPVFQGIQRG